MSKKPKRIRAAVLFTDSDGTLWKERVPGTERAYLLRQSDIRALAEQIVADSQEYVFSNPKSIGKSRVDTALHCLRRAGMTPGKGTQ